MAENNQHPVTPSRPEMREVATTLDGRDITRGYVDGLPLLPPQDTVLQARGYYDYAIYDEVLRDDQVKGTFENRRRAVVSKEWEVIPGGDKRIDKAAAAFIEETLDHIRFDDVTDKMLYGVFYGYAVGECLWARDGRHVVLDMLKVRDRRRFGFRPTGDLVLKTSSNPDGEELKPRKFWHFATGATHDDEPYGLGLAHWLYWPVLFKRNGIKFWLIFLEKFGMPTGVGKFPSNASPAERTKLLAAVRAIQADSGVIIPEGMALELLEAARSGTADYTALHDRMNAAISKVVLGHSAGADSTPGRLGGEDTANEVRDDLIKADSDLVCHSANASWVRWLVDWNFPGAAYPMVWRRIEDEPDLLATAQRDEKVASLGFKPTLEYIRETYGDGWEEAAPATSPESGDQSATGDAPARESAQGSAQKFDAALINAYSMGVERFARMGMEIPQNHIYETFGLPKPSPGDARLVPLRSATPGEPQQDAGDPSFADAIDSPPDYPQVAAATLGRAAEAHMRDWLDVLRAILDTAGSLQEAQAQIEAAYADLDPGPMTAVLGEALAAADLAGRFEAQQGDGDGA